MRNKIEETALSAQIRKRFRESLISIGKSPDFHIYDLDKAFKKSQVPKKSSAFLKRITSFYKSLNYADQRLFIIECLEKGRHYPFWYLGKYPDGSFLPAYENLLERLEELPL